MKFQVQVYCIKELTDKLLHILLQQSESAIHQLSTPSLLEAPIPRDAFALTLLSPNSISFYFKSLFVRIISLLLATSEESK